MKRPIYLVVILLGMAVLFGALLFGIPFTSADEPQRPSAGENQTPANGKPGRAGRVNKFMQEKLDASNQVLEGLVTEDFELIQKGVATMRRLSAAEQWQVTNDALYRQYSIQFRRVLDDLDKKAKEKQLEGAALAWVDATMNCLECHKWARNNIIAGGSSQK